MAPDGPEQIRHVSDTALMVAACRAIEAARADGLVRDPQTPNEFPKAITGAL
jgi:O-methyltransferase involved in polyketide biosynthesis